MKHLVCLFLLPGFASVCLAQQTFEEGDLSGWVQQPPGRWEISADHALSGTRSLHHAYDNSSPGVDHIARNLESPDLSDTLEFTFRLRHAYPPSSSNNWQLFCLSDRPSGQGTSGSGSSIVFGVNFKGYDDRIKLWQVSGDETAEIFDTGINYQEQIGTEGSPLFRLIRFPGGMWSAEVSMSGTTGELAPAGDGVELHEATGKYTGFRYAYSSSQDRKLWIDDLDITGSFYRDTIAPGVTGILVSGMNTIEITFSEPLGSYDPAGLQWDIHVPDSVMHRSEKLQLWFAHEFPNRIPQQLRVSGVSDSDGNMASDTILGFMQDLAAYGDIIINELMTDPEPAVYLPPCEYIELRNRYTSSIDLTGWTISVNDKEYELSHSVLAPGGYLLLTHYGCAAAYPASDVLGIISSSTALTNDEGEIILQDRYGRPVHRVEYDEMERYDRGRSDGGWSLERADPDLLCGGKANWIVSDDMQGGSPGRSNSMVVQHTDLQPPVWRHMGLKGDSLVTISFNEELFFESASAVECMLNGERLAAPAGRYPLVGSTVEFPAGDALVVDGPNRLELAGWTDCPGNRADPVEISFCLPSIPEAGSSLINEVMYDPGPGGNEYIELWNAGEQYYDLYDMVLTLHDPGEEGGGGLRLSDQSRIFFPGEFVVITRSDYALRAEWDLEDGVSVISPPGWKTLPDNGACLTLRDRAGVFVDRVCYHDSLHHDMTGITSGVSLERTMSGECRLVSQCWTSAGSSVDYGTPGTRNSQFTGDIEADGVLFLDPVHFSPDGDGWEDLMVIGVNRIGEEEVYDLVISDLEGRIIRRIIDSAIPGEEDLYTWDGTDENGKIVSPGIYVIHLQVHGPHGRRAFRKPCALSYR